MKLFLIILALIYILSPYDLLSDFLAGWGWLDDLMVLYVLWKYVFSGFPQKRPYSRTRQWNSGTGGWSSHSSQSRDNFSDPNQKPEEKSPYTILGVSENASAEEIRKAYKELVTKYHPDKVQHLGDEFRDLAEKKFKEIQEAYQKLCPK